METLSACACVFFRIAKRIFANIIKISGRGSMPKPPIVPSDKFPIEKSARGNKNGYQLLMVAKKKVERKRARDQ